MELPIDVLSLNTRIASLRGEDHAIFSQGYQDGLTLPCLYGARVFASDRENELYGEGMNFGRMVAHLNKRLGKTRLQTI